MISSVKLPKTIPVFPLSNFIIFPQTSVPLNIFEPRYIDMINDSMKSDRIIGMIQPKELNQKNPELYKIGCAGKITSFNETEDGRYIIVIRGLSRFKIMEEINSKNSYRSCDVDFDIFKEDLKENKTQINFSDLKLIFKNIKTLFNKEGYTIDWKKLEKQNLNETINTLSMASPFNVQEKQILLETLSLDDRKQKLEDILNTYLVDNFNNKTLQ